MNQDTKTSATTQSVQVNIQKISNIKINSINALLSKEREAVFAPKKDQVKDQIILSKDINAEDDSNLQKQD
jgi:hypothetical protein